MYAKVFDALLSDVSADMLSRYDTVIVAHALQSNSLAIAHRLEHFVAYGGQLVITFDSLADLGSAGAAIGAVGLSVPQSEARDCPLHASLHVTFVDGSTLVEPHPQRLCALNPPPGAVVLATATGNSTAAAPVAYRTQPNGRGGSVTVLAIGNYGVTPGPLPVGTPCQEDKPTLSAQPLAASVARLLSDVMADQALFDIGGPNTSLSWVPKRVSDTTYMIGVSNTQLSESPLLIRAKFGTVVSQADIRMDDSEKQEAGYLPHGFEGHDVGRSTNTTIAGADFRMLRVVVRPSPGVAGGGDELGCETTELSSRNTT